MGSFARATLVHQRARAHILAASDYSLVKEQSLFLRRRPHQVLTARFAVAAPFKALPAWSGEAESYRSSRPCQSAVRKIFVQPSAAAAMTVRPTTCVASLRLVANVKSVARATSNLNRLTPQFKSPRPVRGRVEGTNPTNCAAGDHTTRTSLVKPHVFSRFPGSTRQVALTVALRQVVKRVRSAERSSRRVRRPRRGKLCAAPDLGALTPRASASGSVGAALEASVSQGTYRNFLPR